MMSAEQHYNKVAQNPPTQCQQMRVAHNVVKGKIIHRALQCVGKDLSTCTIVDFACGRGGDLNKVQRAFHYVGIDTAFHALVELQRRANEIGMRVHLHHCDATKAPVLAESADIALCNFALHYFCGSKIRCTKLCEKIAMVLKPGACWCGTYEKIFGEVKWGMPFHAVIGDCVNAVEYRVPWQEFTNICYDFGLSVVFHEPFYLHANHTQEGITGFILQKARVLEHDTTRLG